MENKPTCEALEQRITDLERERNGDKGIPQRREDSDQMYRQILENISDTVIITDDQGNMVYVSPNTTRIFGLSQEQVYNQKSIQRLINGTVCDIATLKIQQKIENIEWSINDSSGKELLLQSICLSHESAKPNISISMNNCRQVQSEFYL